MILKIIKNINIMSKQIFARISIEDLIVPIEMEQDISKYIEVNGHSLRTELICYENEDGEEIDEDDVKR